ncbi:MAG: hypothetical protein CMG74_08960 [Candidatus Marinimicrobia bacterium]|nr:hypothetical protein [Candidatus Neomarinimicrobiota bacterium]
MIKFSLDRERIMKHILKILSLFVFSIIWAQDDDDLDMDAMWESTIWEEIEEVTTEEYEVEKITAVAGVRGVEAEDEALHHLYYRKSMKGIDEGALKNALGKMLNTLSVLKEKNPEHKKIPQLTHLVCQLYLKLGDEEKAKLFENELLTIAPDMHDKYYK